MHSLKNKIEKERILINKQSLYEMYVISVSTIRYDMYSFFTGYYHDALSTNKVIGHFVENINKKKNQSKTSMNVIRNQK